ncbi:RNA-binding protein with serine-rich domain 1-like [Budorcas taxicolor]|uniref:RNA-binding protein with serine-rich domain 1-like n=1 Tax=Budorcas taxicolor TaxID=37181 RepID=UPI002283A626|nr:RNA-binding protein with serine-rich domain 1-like [Budorcas taxicolor]
MAPSPTRCRENSDEQSRDRSRDKAGPKESREKYRGRARTRRWSGASSGSSSSRSPSSGSTSSGSSSGSSSPSASSRSGRPSTACSSSSSSSSSSSPGSLRPSWLRRGKRQRSHSKQPERDEKEGRRHSPSPKPTKLHIARLTRNVTKDHIREIFSTFGKVRVIDMPVERMHPGLSDAYVEFETPDGAEKALKYMDGGQLPLGSGPRSAGDPTSLAAPSTGAAAAPGPPEAEGSNRGLSQGSRVPAAVVWGRACKDALHSSG